MGLLDWLLYRPAREGERSSSSSSGTGDGSVGPGDNTARLAAERQLKQIEGLALRFFAIVIAFSFAYALAQISSVLVWAVWLNALKVLAILVGLCAAAAVVGGLLGFLFGIPRLLQYPARAVAVAAATPAAQAPGAAGEAETPAAPAQPSPPSDRFLRGNTNLEEISDWITKIIVGLTLVQAKEIYGAATTAAQEFAKALPGTAGADVVFLVIVISATVAGFLFFYMETRTRVTLLLGDIESIQDGGAQLRRSEAITAVLEAPIISKSMQTGVSKSGAEEEEPKPISADEKILKIPYGDLRTSREFAAWALAQARAGNLAAASRALQEAITRDPGNPDLLVSLADVQQRLGNAQAVVNLLSEARSKGADDPTLLKRELLVSLYLNPPEGFTKAIATAKKLLALPDEEKDPWVHLWHAAAQGQRYEYLRGRQSADADAARAEALAAVHRVVELAPDPDNPARATLRQIFDPEREQAPRDDNDLEVFKSDPDFRATIYPSE